MVALFAYRTTQHAPVLPLLTQRPKVLEIFRDLDREHPLQVSRESHKTEPAAYAECCGKRYAVPQFKSSVPHALAPKHKVTQRISVSACS